MGKRLTIKEIQSRIDGIEGNYYKGSSQTEEWWRITGDVHPTDRRLWTLYQGLKNKREKETLENFENDHVKFCDKYQMWEGRKNMKDILKMSKGLKNPKSTRSSVASPSDNPEYLFRLLTKAHQHIDEMRDYNQAYNIFMDHFDSLPSDVKKVVLERLHRLDLPKSDWRDEL